jgi:hypothetical protein
MSSRNLFLDRAALPGAKERPGKRSDPGLWPPGKYFKSIEIFNSVDAATVFQIKTSLLENAGVPNRRL